MSLPKQTVPHLSASSSKQSLRASNNTVPRSRTGAVEPHATSSTPSESGPAGELQLQHQHQHQHHGDGVSSEERRHSFASSQQPQFRPFFTLVEDTNASEHYHPTVHYIFSDDDTDIVTEAALRSLEADHGIVPPVTTGQEVGTTYEGDPELEDSRQSDVRKTSSLPPPIPGVREHYIILDMEPTNPEQLQNPDPATGGGPPSLSTSPAAPQQQQPPPQFTVTSAQSLTPAWQVLKTHLTPAPTFDTTTSPGDQQQQPGLSSGVMLKIEGTSGQPREPILRDRDSKDGGQTLEEMMEQFEKRMGELRLVIEAGGGLPAHEGRGIQETEAEGEENTEQEPPGQASPDPAQQSEEQETDRPQ
ncbi:hypothetical protein C8Q69DRAFT_196528 [Paecilomyces variotii]|uniref:Anaphase promoting complex subunit 11 n=1 Tax=Byssochlamys spectabilis TaxID=264951 RepID=A0A443HH72_BYSSP|nr:hypothetical protein C8Q69DRAFT_196528 [Paecilomyces variotii]KAJ9316128.1 hypothetical protein DTO271D3_3704 [Paecilomyces variotii]KAJ9349928.1 hypothetical protein DTO280E4_8843 [Paecilomyces variotii]RWQ91192.1 hypothetical protein C8Q69DRAFT_196528 [Paecilomyces variotii]